MLAVPAVLAHDPITTNLTWTAEISRIIYRHCAGCHKENGPAPMPLLRYRDARPWAKAIRDEVLARRMPPWGAVKGVGEFRDDPSLSQPEMDMIVAWVEGGAPEGDPAYLPAPPAAEPARDPEPSPSKEMVLEAGWPQLLSQDTDVISLRPDRLPRGGSLEVTAYLPDGAIRHLLWVREYRPEWQRTYFLRQPARLPSGARVVAYSAAAARVVIGVAKPAR